MAFTVSLIGFGEAAQAFAGGAGWDACAFDIADRQADLTRCHVARARDSRGAVSRAAAVLNLVTPVATLAAATAAAPHLAPDALWFDLTSVAPATKRAAAAVIEAGGGRYVDAAIMAPVLPRRRGVPILLAGPHAAAGEAVLAAAGFTDLRIVAGPVGMAAAIKMIRSVMIKGIEALTAECVLAAHRAGVTGEVLDSLEPDWAARADYNLDRMLVHGARRADELGEVVATLADLGVDPAMSRAAATWQRRLATGSAPAGLAAKLAMISDDSLVCAA
jgi:3-hydroxyisobutyrate dehydrogenase-like beta-hydroxyacid dehydrogenase